MDFFTVLSNGFSKSITHFPQAQHIRAGNKMINNDIDGLLHDTFRNEANEFNENERTTNRLNEEARIFYKLVEDGKQELYAGCANFSKLSFIIHLYLCKCLNALSNVAFNDLLDLLK